MKALSSTFWGLYVYYAVQVVKRARGSNFCEWIKFWTPTIHTRAPAKQTGAAPFVYGFNNMKFAQGSGSKSDSNARTASFGSAILFFIRAT